MDDVERVAQSIRTEIAKQLGACAIVRPDGGIDIAGASQPLCPVTIATAAVAAMDAWRPIDENTPTNTKIFLWCPERIRGAPVGAVFGRVVKHRDLPVQAYGEGMNGDWTFTYWRPLPAPPTAAGSEG